MALLIIDAVQAVGVASSTLVNVELTDQRGDAVVGYVTASNQVVVLPTTVTTDTNGQVTIDLIPNAEIEPGNTCYTVRIAEKQFLIQKSANPQNLFDALVVDPGDLDPIDQNALDDHINDPFNAHFGSAIGFVPFDTMVSDNVQDAIEETWTAAVLGLDTASEIEFTPTGDIGATNVQDAIVEVDTELHAHIDDASDAHDASAISVVPFGTIAAINVQAALEEIVAEGSTGSAIDTTFTPTGDIAATNVQDAIVEVDAELHAHEADAVDAHDASAISFVAGSGIDATDVQAAISEVRADSLAYTDAHITDTVDAHDASAVSFVPANVLDTTNVQDAIVELGESFSTPKTPSGFPNTTDTTISFVDAGADLTFTIAPVGASFDVWLFGDKHTKTSESVSTPDGLDRVYYFYYDSAGVLSVVTNATQPTGFIWSTQVPVAIGFRNATGNDLVLFDLRHGLSMDWATRGYLHQSRGTVFGTGLVLSSYTLSPGAPVDADNTWSLTSGTIYNEDLTYSISAVAAGGPYTTLYKSGTGAFSTATAFGSSVPFATVAGDLAYNLNTAGSYSLAAVPNGSFVNYFIFVTGSQTSGYQVLAFPEETVYASQALAEAAPITSPFTVGGFAFSEFFMRYRVTYQRSNAYTNTGRCRTVAVTQITNSQTLIVAGSTPSSHNSLSGRDVADTHPATAITFTPAAGIAATTVQAAIEETVADTAAGFVPKDGSYAATTTDVVSSRVTGNANPQFTINTDGAHEWGNGTAALDTNLYRSAPNFLKTDDSLWVANQVGIGITPSSAAALTLPTGTTATQGILFDNDVTLYRSAPNTLKTDDAFVAASFSSAGAANVLSVGVGAAPAGFGDIRMSNGSLINVASGSSWSLGAAGSAVFTITNNLFTVADGANIAFNVTTGTKFGTGTTQKIGFWNATPIAQPSSTGETVGFTAGAGTNVTDQSTFTGNVGATAYGLSDIVKHLKNIGLIAP